MNPTLERFLTPLAVVLGALLIAVAMVWGNANPVPSATDDPSQPPVRTADISKVQIAGEPFIGNPNAPITIAYWYDYQCPFCQRHEQQTMPQLIKEYVDTGKVRIVFKDFQFLSADSQTLGQYSRAVWETAPDKFYAWHKAVYDNQGQENTGWATPEVIRRISVGAIGEVDTARAIALVKENGAEYQKEMDADKREGGDFGVRGTPGTIIGKQLVSGAVSYAEFKAAIEAAVK